MNGEEDKSRESITIFALRKLSAKHYTYEMINILEYYLPDNYYKDFSDEDYESLLDMMNKNFLVDVEDDNGQTWKGLDSKLPPFVNFSPLQVVNYIILPEALIRFEETRGHTHKEAETLVIPRIYQLMLRHAILTKVWFQLN